jgi:hypothetical protein
MLFLEEEPQQVVAKLHFGVVMKPAFRPRPAGPGAGIGGMSGTTPCQSIDIRLKPAHRHPGHIRPRNEGQEKARQKASRAPPVRIQLRPAGPVSHPGLSFFITGRPGPWLPFSLDICWHAVQELTGSILRQITQKLNKTSRVSISTHSRTAE